MIRDVLIPKIRTEFHGLEISFNEPPEPIVVFAPARDAVGKALIYDDGEEATVCIEKITHSHFNPYDASMSQGERDEWVAQQVIEFLHALFADKILLYIHKNGGSAGWMDIARRRPAELSPDNRYFLWSKPFSER